MARRVASAALLLAAACGDRQTAEQQALAAAADESDKVECAVDGGAEFERVCRLERMTGPEGLVLTLRAPSGTFRRLLVTGDGRGVVAADGAEAAAVTPVDDDRIEVAIAGDRYRLPATVRR
jgi:hypothetical protein